MSYLRLVRVLSKRTLREFWERRPDSQQQLLAWYKDFKATGLESTEELMANFGNCRSIGSNRYIFNIRGNNYRLVVKISFELQTAWIRFIGTHSQYDKIDPQTI